MRRIAFLAIIIMLAATAAYADYNPYAAAAGYRYPYYDYGYSHPSHHDDASHMPGDLMIRMIADTLGTDMNRARLIAVMYVYSDLLDRTGCFRNVQDYMSGLLQDMRRAMEGWRLTYAEDQALRDLSDRLSVFTSGRKTGWNELRWAVEDTFPPFIRLLSSGRK